jgi:UDP-glucose 4-epimerase
MKILVTGATGAIGPVVVKALYAAGHQVRALSLDPPPAGDWPDGIEALTGDITDVSAVQAAMEGIDAVIHMAALLHIVNPPPGLREKYERVNVGGTAVVVDAAVQAGVRRIVFFSTIAVYGSSGGRVLTEDTPPCPETFYAKTKHDAEKLVLEAKGINGRPLGTVLRMGAVYGPRIKGNYQRLLRALSLRSFVPIGKGGNRRTLVYDNDAAQAAILAMEHPSAAGRIYNVSDGRFHTVEEIIASMCRALGRTVPRFSLPAGFARHALGFIEDCAGIFGITSPVGRAVIDKYTEDIAVESRRIRSEIGFVSRFDLDSGWTETVDYMRRRGDIP